MKSAEEILKELYCCDYFEDKADLQLQITLNPDLDRILQAMHEYAAQDRWVKVDKDNLPTEKVFACNKHEEYLVGHIHLHNGIIVCSADETVLYYITHYQIPTAPKD